jgi:hypothetical protein
MKMMEKPKTGYCSGRVEKILIETNATIPANIMTVAFVNQSSRISFSIIRDIILTKMTLAVPATNAAPATARAAPFSPL